MSFEENFKTGRITEGLIAKWLMAQRKASIMPAYEIERNFGKGPQLFTQEGSFVAPDMLVFSHNGICWIEAKHKTVFTWYRREERWTTGIDLRHYEDYLRVSERTKLPVWLLFFHMNDTPSHSDLGYGCPRPCPTGLYGGNIMKLRNIESHRCEKANGNSGHGKSGMVYWAEEELKRLATKEQVLMAFDGRRRP